MKFMAEKPYYPIPLPSIASIGTVLSIKPMRVSEAWRFTPVYSNEFVLMQFLHRYQEKMCFHTIFSRKCHSNQTNCEKCYVPIQ